jgi:hypothetical protein
MYDRKHFLILQVAATSKTEMGGTILFQYSKHFHIFYKLYYVNFQPRK